MCHTVNPESGDRVFQGASTGVHHPPLQAHPWLLPAIQKFFLLSHLIKGPPLKDHVGLKCNSPPPPPNDKPSCIYAVIRPHAMMATALDELLAEKVGKESLDDAKAQIDRRSHQSERRRWGGQRQRLLSADWPCWSSSCTGGGGFPSLPRPSPASGSCAAGPTEPPN